MKEIDEVPRKVEAVWREHASSWLTSQRFLSSPSLIIISLGQYEGFYKAHGHRSDEELSKEMDVDTTRLLTMAGEFQNHFFFMGCGSAPQMPIFDMLLRLLKFKAHRTARVQPTTYLALGAPDQAILCMLCVAPVVFTVLS